MNYCERKKMTDCFFRYFSIFFNHFGKLGDNKFTRRLPRVYFKNANA